MKKVIGLGAVAAAILAMASSVQAHGIQRCGPVPYCGASVGCYGLVKDEEESEEEQKEKKVNYGSLRDKFAKSQRGPAMAILVMPSNIIMGEGLFICLGSLAGFLFALWPLVFSNEPMSRDRTREQILIAVGSVFGFLVGGFICYCASCMNELQFYKLVWAGCIVATLPLIGALVAFIIVGVVRSDLIGLLYALPLGFGVGIFKAFKALPTELVKAGFEETIQKAAELKY